MTDKESVSISKYMSFILRHHPERAGITLDSNGWADVAELIASMSKPGRVAVTLEDIQYVVANNDKQRFAFNDDLTKIRANQGHSIPVDVQLKEAEPPDTLFHGTSKGAVQGILENGIVPKQRLYVHLSGDEQTALKVGQRHGKPIVLEIDAEKMVVDGYKFYLSENNVWLTNIVPVAYIRQS